MITERTAYAIASSWGSYVRAGDPGACFFYGFRVNDGRPVSEAHRSQCLAYCNSLIVDLLDRDCRETADDIEQLRQLRDFLTSCDIGGRA